MGPRGVRAVSAADPSVIWMQVVENQGAMLAAVAGYRGQCEEAGFSPSAAEQMAVDFHSALLHMVWTTRT